MIIDSLLEFADATALSTASDTASVIFGNVVDTNPDGYNTLQDLGTGTPLYWVISVDTTVAAVSGTTTFRLSSDSTANLATSITTHIISPTFATATLVKGYTWACPLPSGQIYERYLGVWTTQATATITAGKINSYITADIPNLTQYNDNVSQNA